MKVIRRETEADRLQRLEGEVRMLKMRATQAPVPEVQRSLVREALIKRWWPFRLIVVMLTMAGAGLGELVAGGVGGAALGAGTGYALPLIFEEPLIAALADGVQPARAEDGGRRRVD